MQRVVVIGGGYAGLSALRILGRARGEVEAVLVDPRDGHHALPLLPDVVGRDMAPAHLVYPYARAARRWRFTHRRAAVRAVDVETRTVETTGGALGYDALLVASGSVTHFHGMHALRERAYTFHSTEDAARLREAAADPGYETLVVVGGSYTGVEVATNLWRACRVRGLARRILLVDLGPRLCARLPEPFQDYVHREVASLGIETRLETTVETTEARTVTLKSGERFDRALLVWVAGFRAPEYVKTLPFPTVGAGRLRVDPHLCVDGPVFAAGDAAAFQRDGRPLRMSVQFSLSGGARAAANLLCLARGERLRAWRPHDPGYLVPMAHNRACGKVLGRTSTGRDAMALHYLMCVLRSYGWANRCGVMRDLLSAPRVRPAPAER